MMQAGKLENWIFARSKSSNDTFVQVNNKGAEQTEDACLGLCCLHTPEDRVFYVGGPYNILLAYNHRPIRFSSVHYGES